VTLDEVSYGADFAVLDLASPLANSYGTENTLVSSVLEQESVAGIGANFELSSIDGSVDTATVVHWIVLTGRDRRALDAGVHQREHVHGVRDDGGRLARRGFDRRRFHADQRVDRHPVLHAQGRRMERQFPGGEQAPSIPFGGAADLVSAAGPAGTFSLANDYARSRFTGERLMFGLSKTYPAGTFILRRSMLYGRVQVARGGERVDGAAKRAGEFRWGASGALSGNKR